MNEKQKEVVEIYHYRMDLLIEVFTRGLLSKLSFELIDSLNVVERDSILMGLLYQK